MLDLFANPVVPGFRSQDAIISPAEESDLIARINGANLAPFRFQQWTGKRLTCSFGWSYDFETGSFARTEPIPLWLLPVRQRAAEFAGLAANDLVQALVTRYDPGAGIGWHKDRPVFDHVVGISLGASAAMRLRKRTDKGFARVAVPLATRSIYHLSGEVRHRWEHSIAEMEATRWSITFRSLSDAAVRGAAARR